MVLDIAMTLGTAELGHRLRTNLSDGFKPRLRRLSNEGHLARHAASPGPGLSLVHRQ